ncbi:Arm DNA-binding domain-containing protein [Pedobacter hartonius]|uniref:Phage integrase SAM-like domain-containing protein n=1 Tax=Pedobacter hartonius TaxID=425514 RepID=A0A1H4HIK9_9SPHI|nr:Phage integrase SAM-like domain-containing protein [Pedobacter hartonius]
MKTTFSLLFYLKKPKNYLKGAAPIYLRITVDGKRAELSASRECDPPVMEHQKGTRNRQ